MAFCVSTFLLLMFSSILSEERRRLDAEHLDLRAPGIERKNSQTNLFSSDSFQTFGGDYEEKKLMANKGLPA